MATAAAKRRPATKKAPAAPAPSPSSAAKVVTKTTDSKGRVVLGGKFANRPVIIQRLSDIEVIVKLARVIPESEAWLYENPEALAAVRSGLAHARAGKLTKGPELDADAKLVAELEG